MLVRNWYTFKDQFELIIHTNKTLDDAHKMHYSKSSLFDSVTEVIASTLSTSEFYSNAWSLLTRRFDNKLFIV